MDTIIWLDGHTSKISSKEASSKSGFVLLAKKLGVINKVTKTSNQREKPMV